MVCIRSYVLYISLGYDITGWQMQFVTRILTRIKGNFMQIAYQMNKKIRTKSGAVLRQTS